MKSTRLAPDAGRAGRAAGGGCGGGGGERRQRPGRRHRPRRHHVSQGPINGFGSVIVNGVHYSTAARPSPSRPAAASSPSCASARSCASRARSTRRHDRRGAHDHLQRRRRGPDAGDRPRRVAPRRARPDRAGRAGHVVRRSHLPRILAACAVGDRVEVSGSSSAGGVIAATRIERKRAAASRSEGHRERRRHGRAPIRDRPAAVDYSAAQVSNFASGQPANGDLVEVHGSVNGVRRAGRHRLERRSAALAGTTATTRNSRAS